jgi:flagellar motor switch protein FliN/FliY
MQAPEASAILKFAAKQFSNMLTEALTEISSSSWRVELADETPTTRPEIGAAAWFQCSFEGSCVGEAFLAFPDPVLSALSLRDIPQDAPDLQAAQRAQLLIGLKKGLVKLCTSLDESGATSVLIDGVDAPVLTDEPIIELSIRGDAGTPDAKVSLYLCFGRKLLAGLKALSPEPFVFPEATTLEGANLDLVMGVELNVSLRFGQRQLALREVLELTSGSVVELDRQVDEPVELVLDGRVVARGEAVIIDGNYGMRITQLMPHPLL